MKKNERNRRLTADTPRTKSWLPITWLWLPENYFISSKWLKPNDLRVWLNTLLGSWSNEHCAITRNCMVPDVLNPDKVWRNFTGWRFPNPCPTSIHDPERHPIPCVLTSTYILHSVSQSVGDSSLTLCLTFVFFFNLTKIYHKSFEAVLYKH